MLTAKEILHLGQTVLSLPAGSAEVVDAVERYVHAFEMWFKSNDPETLKHEPEAAAILELHTAVIQKAREVIMHTENEKKDLKTKAKVLLKYIDTLPSKISWTRGTKG